MTPTVPWQVERRFAAGLAVGAPAGIVGWSAFGVEILVDGIGGFLVGWVIGRSLPVALIGVLFGSVVGSLFYGLFPNRPSDGFGSLAGALLTALVFLPGWLLGRAMQPSGGRYAAAGVVAVVAVTGLFYVMVLNGLGTLH